MPVNEVLSAPDLHGKAAIAGANPCDSLAVLQETLTKSAFPIKKG